MNKRVFNMEQLKVGDAVKYGPCYGIVRRKLRGFYGGSFYYVEFLHPTKWFSDIAEADLQKFDGGLLAIMAVAQEVGVV